MSQNEAMTEEQKTKAVTQLKNAIEHKQALMERAKQKEAANDPIQNADFAVCIPSSFFFPQT